ncbi:glutamate 5-kinase [Teredinibacter haidensis]|uniref:glutamate 5-kinase n=1 Tax=Teredinibacter haidensis TaxID=2731755 RepID=UPI000948D477|nr:glutamate 5-kinase [Teredinibacter haidensis]
MSKRMLVKQGRRWVIKIGSALLTDNGRGLDREAMAIWVEQIAALSKKGYEVVLVSSGAVAAGMTKLGWKSRPKAIHEQQAAAAVGQSSLIQVYEEEFHRFSKKTAQVLLDHDDLSNRQRYLNARSTLSTLIDMGVVPIINENDTVVTEEIRFGDNDTLAALVANLIEADVLCILTDQKGMYDCDPRKSALAEIVFEKSALSPDLDAMASSGGALGRGGMISKVRAARLAARSGASTVIVGGKIPDVMPRIASGELLGTLLYSDQQPIAARKQWLAGHLQSRGVVVCDDGAVTVLREQGKSLLPVGVVGVDGHFTRGEMVLCHDSKGNEVARGLVNYSSDDARKIMGQPTTKIEGLLGYKDFDELIHRDNLVLS